MAARKTARSATKAILARAGSRAAITVETGKRIRMMVTERKTIRGRTYSLLARNGPFGQKSQRAFCKVALGWKMMLRDDAVLFAPAGRKTVAANPVRVVRRWLSTFQD